MTTASCATSCNSSAQIDSVEAKLLRRLTQLWTSRLTDSRPFETTQHDKGNSQMARWVNSLPLSIIALFTSGAADLVSAETTCSAFPSLGLTIDGHHGSRFESNESARCIRTQVITGFNSAGKLRDLPSTDTSIRPAASQLRSTAAVSGWIKTPPEDSILTLARSPAERPPQPGDAVNGPFAVSKLQVGPLVDAKGLNPIYSYMNESTSPGPGVFGPSHVFVVNRLGGNGNREAVHIEADSSVGQVGDQIVGGLAAGRIVAGSGTAYGWNPYARVDAIAGPGSQAIGQEVNVDVRRDVAAKVGVQIVDVATSTGEGTSIDAALLLSRQTGARGFQTGIQFGYNSKDPQAAIDAGYGIRPGGTLINALPTTLSLQAGLDLSGVQKPFTDAAVKLAVGNTIRFGANGMGGSVSSRTSAEAGSILFEANATILDFGGGQQNIFGPTGYTTTGSITEAASATPARSSAPCAVGQHAWDANYEYRCVATNHWKRAPLSDF